MNKLVVSSTLLMLVIFTLLASCYAEELDLGDLDDVLGEADAKSGGNSAFGPHVFLAFAVGALAALL